MNRRLVLLVGGVLASAAIAVAADVPALPHPIGSPVVFGITPNTGTTVGGSFVHIFGRDANRTTGVKFGNRPAMLGGS